MREQIISRSNAEARNFRLGLLFAFGGTALFALKSILIKLAYAQGVDPVTLLTLRMLVAAPFYLVVFLWLRYQVKLTRPSQKDWLAIIILGSMSYYA